MPVIRAFGGMAERLKPPGKTIGEVAEWFKAAVLKTAVTAMSPRVRIPVSPPPFV